MGRQGEGGAGKEGKGRERITRGERKCKETKEGLYMVARNGDGKGAVIVE